VMGMTREQAEQVIASAGLLLGEVTEQRAPLPRGQVLESRPTAGERVPIPSAVELVVSTGPETVQVPEVVGEGYAEARTLLSQLGLRVGDVAVDPSSSLPANTVVAQTPAAGRAVEGGAAVSLTISGREPR
jgi:eukaryotic-like serine/threonine-protein kinase